MSKKARRLRVSAPRRALELTPIQKHREKLLIDLGVTKAQIARALGTNKTNVQGVFRDRFRSLGPDGLEQQIVLYLRNTADRAQEQDGNAARTDPNSISLESMGWREPVMATNETPVSSIATVTGES